MNELENCVGLDLFIHFGDTVGGLMYLFVMTILTLDRFAEIHFEISSTLQHHKDNCITDTCFYYFMFVLRWFVYKFNYKWK